MRAERRSGSRGREGGGGWGVKGREVTGGRAGGRGRCRWRNGNGYSHPTNIWFSKALDIAEVCLCCYETVGGGEGREREVSLVLLVWYECRK